jgi:hypothetical protein
MRKGALYSNDVAILISAALRDSIDGDVSIQSICLCLVLLHTGGRPSTFLAAKYTHFSCTGDDMRWIPRPDAEGATVGFDVTLRLRRFKGYGLNGSDRQAKTMHLYIRTISKESNLVFDLGSVLMAHTIRSGPFGAVTVSDTWSKKDANIEVDPAFLELSRFHVCRRQGFRARSSFLLKMVISGQHFQGSL